MHFPGASYCSAVRTTTIKTSIKSQDKNKISSVLHRRPREAMEGKIVFAGMARKIALVFIALSFVGWIIYVAGFGELVDKIKETDSDFNPGKEVRFYPYWVASVVGPVVYIVAVIHALLWRHLSGCVGSITAVLSMWYITGLSYGLVEGGIAIRDKDTDEETYHKLLFAGGFLAALGWTGVLALWPWYKTDIDCKRFSGI